MLTPKASVSKAIRAKRLELPGIGGTERKSPPRGKSDLRTTNNSVFESRRRSHGNMAEMKQASRNFGFRNHSFALGSTVRHH